MSDFFQTPACLSGDHCERCRSIEHAQYRARTAEFYGLPPDFPCPPERGAKPMGYQRPVVVQMTVSAKPAKPATKPATASPRKPKPLPEPMARSLWPKLIGGMAWFRKAGERGVGDTVHNQLSVIGGDVVALVIKFAGISCGCEDRRAWLNARYPYE